MDGRMTRLRNDDHTVASPRAAPVLRQILACIRDVMPIESAVGSRPRRRGAAIVVAHTDKLPLVTTRRVDGQAADA